ncbi:MAG: hypothetical protein ACT4N5_05440 [Nitrosopumilaceae archaeon]
MKTLHLSIIAVIGIAIIGAVSFVLILDARDTLPNQTIIPDDNQVTLTGEYAHRICNALNLPCPTNPTFHATKLDNQSFNATVEVNGKPYTVTLNDTTTCVTPTLFGSSNCYFETVQKTWAETDPFRYGGKLESVFNSKNGTGLVVLKAHEEVNIIFTYNFSNSQSEGGNAGYAIHGNNKLITDSENFTANELPKTFTFAFTPQNTGIFVFTKGIKFNSDNSHGEESQSIIVVEKFSKAMAFNGQCKKPFPEYTLVVKPDFSTGACVKMDTALKLKERGWH